jgi:hypothetical protein
MKSLALLQSSVAPGPACRRASRVALHVAGAALLPALALAQEGPSAVETASKISIVPRVSVTETYTNNARLDDANRRSDLLSQISPGFRISSNGGRIRGSIDYALTELLYANNSYKRQTLNNLNAFGTVEAVDNWAFLDFSGNVGQQSISAFGTPSNGIGVSGGNSTETSVFRLSPYVRGRLAGVADYLARYSITNTSSGSSALADSVQRDAQLKVNGGQPNYGLSWSLDATHQSVDYSAARSTSSSLYNTRLQYAITPQWAVFGRAGREANDFAVAVGDQSNFTALGAVWTPNPDLRASLDRDSRGFTGFGLNWAPSKRTSVSITREGRIYGATHNVALAYRTPSTAWAFSDSRSAVSNPAQGPGIQSISLYDLLTSQFAAGELDSAKREQYDAFLLANGIKPGLTAVGGFLSSSVSLQRSQQLSFAMFGARSTVTMVATRSQSNRLDSLSTALDDFLTSNTVVQNGLSANYAYRLTGKSVVSLTATRQVSSSSGGVAGTSLKSYIVNLSTQFSRDTSASIGARRVVFDSNTTPYSETAVTGNLIVQF